MPKRCIGIDIGSSYLRAVQLSRTNGRFNVEKVFTTQTRRSTDSPADILKSLTTRRGFDRRADVAISMPHNSVFYRSLVTDVDSIKQFSSSGSAALEHHFPIQPIESVAHVCSYRQMPDQKCSVLVAATKKESLQERLNTLSEANLKPNLVEAPIFAVRLTVAVNHPQAMTGKALIVYIDLSYITLAVIEDSNVLLVRNIPNFSRSDGDIYALTEQIAQLLSSEVEITWQKVFQAPLDQSTCIYLAAGHNLPKNLLAILKENLNCQITVVNPYAKVTRLPDSNGTADISLAQGLALSALVSEQAEATNFLKADTAKAKHPLNLKKEFTICAILLAAIAAVSFLGLLLRLSRLEDEYSNVKNEIKELFQSTLPQEKNIVSPLAQLEQKLQSLHKDYRLFAPLDPAHLDPLEALHSITKSIPSKTAIRIDDLLITDDSIRLNGTCDSFETVYHWQSLLQKIPQFKLVDVQDVQKLSQSGSIRFTILINPGFSEKI
ncbi:MAG: pilus assembly protein PilM [Planctomycetota bacterium]|nr:MAG: pilus assembly protein PilM [Planctomycetota bacterium]